MTLAHFWAFSWNDSVKQLQNCHEGMVQFVDVHCSLNTPFPVSTFVHFWHNPLPPPVWTSFMDDPIVCTQQCGLLSKFSDLLLFSCLLYHRYMYIHTHTRLTGVWDYPGEPVPERQNQSGFYWSKRQWEAVASAGPYASLHLAADRNHASTPPLSFLQAGCLSCRPANSIRALKAHFQPETLWPHHRHTPQPSLAPYAGANYIQGGDADVLCTAWFCTTLLAVVIHICRRHATPTQAQVCLHWAAWRSDLSSVNYRRSCLSCCWSKGVEWPAKRSYVGLVAVSVQEQAEDILVLPLLRNCLTFNYIPLS